MRARNLLPALVILCVGYTATHAITTLSAQGSEKAALKNALKELENAIVLMTGGAMPLPPPQRVPGIPESLFWFQVQTDQWIPRTADEGRGLRQSIERMTRAVRSTRDRQAQVALLGIIQDDLAAKVESCRREGLATRRRVSVVTKRDGVLEMRGFEVLYLEKFLENDPSATPQQFRGFSSPAVDDLVPGRYVFWAKEPGRTGRSGARKEGRVSVDSPGDPIEVLTP